MRDAGPGPRWEPVTARTTAIRSGDVHPNNVTAAPPDYFAALESLRDKLKAEPELVILFNDAIKGEDVRRAGRVRRVARAFR